MYTLTFKTRHLVVLVICTVLLGMLLVLLGYLLGYSLGSSHSPSQPMSQASSQGASGPRVAAAQTGQAVAAPAVLSQTALPANPATAGVKAPALTGATAAGEISAAKGYALQFGSFDNKAQAEEKIKVLKAENVKAELFSGADTSGMTHFAVRSGAFDDPTSASKAADALATATGEFVVVRPADRL